MSRAKGGQSVLDAEVVVVALVGARANFDGLHGETETCVCQAVTNENGKYAVRVGGGRRCLETRSVSSRRSGPSRVKGSSSVNYNTESSMRGK